MNEPFILENLLRYTGQTVTIFIESGGLSGTGFTGILAGVSNNILKLITNIGPAPTYPLINNTYRYCENFNNLSCTRNKFCPRCINKPHNNNYFGAITEIPINKIISFTHNAT